MTGPRRRRSCCDEALKHAAAARYRRIREATSGHTGTHGQFGDGLTLREWADARRAAALAPQTPGTATAGRTNQTEDQMTTTTKGCGECEDGIVYLDIDNPRSEFYCGGCSGVTGIRHEPACGKEPCPNGCWDRLNPEQVADRFNALHQVGTPVRYWTGIRKGEGEASTTRTAAWVLSGVVPVVCVDGYASAVALTHVEPMAVAADVFEQRERDEEARQSEQARIARDGLRPGEAIR